MDSLKEVEQELATVKALAGTTKQEKEDLRIKVREKGPCRIEWLICCKALPGRYCGSTR